MRSLDEILGFLFHSKIGRTVCACAVSALSFAAGGCMIFDGLDCMCGGTDLEPSCWGVCDDGCNELVACGGDCDNTICTALFGAGCEKDCGDCGTWFLSCNPSDCDCGGSCSGCEDVDCSFFGCNVTCQEPIYSHSVEITYVDVNTHREISSKYWTIYSNEEKWETIPEEYLSPSNGYIATSGFYSTCSDDGDLYDLYANASGDIESKTSAWDVSNLYVYCAEKYYGNQCDLTFYATVDGENADDVVAFDAFVFPKYVAYVGVQINGFPSVPEIVGYTFEGFYYNNSLKQIQNGKYFHLYDFTSTETPALSIEMRYVSTKVAVTYDDIDYTVAYGSTLQEFVTDNRIAPKSSNQRFAGFFVTHGDNTEYYVPESAFNTVRIEENTSVRAKFEAPVTLQYYNYYGPTDSRVFTPEETFYENDSYTLLAKPEQATVGLYSFAGWFTESECINQWTQSVFLTETSYQFYAKWNANLNYEISYYRSETEPNPISRQSYTYSETDTITLKTPDELDVSAETGYTFAGWYNVADPEKTAITELPVATHGNIQLCLKKIPRAYEITLQPNGGTVSSGKQTIYYGESFTLPVPTLTGYDFQGWFDVTNKSELLTDETGRSLLPFIPADPSALKFQFYARWQIHTYQVTFVNGDGETTVKNCDYNATIGDLDITPTTKTGYEFIGWFNGSEEYAADKEITEDCTYEAKYEAKTYKITLDAGEGTLATTEVTVKYGERITLPTPTRDGGYAFGGWSCDGTNADFTDFDGEMKTDFNYTNDITVYAIWIALS